MLSENLPNEEYEYSQLQYRIYDKHIPEIARIRKTNDKIFITVDEDMNYVSHRIVPFIEYGKEVEPKPTTTTIEIKPHSSLFKPKTKQRKAIGIELKESYFDIGSKNMAALMEKAKQTSLF